MHRSIGPLTHSHTQILITTHKHTQKQPNQTAVVRKDFGVANALLPNIPESELSNVARFLECARRVNATAPVLQLSATRGAGTAGLAGTWKSAKVRPVLIDNTWLKQRIVS